jgi:hypothetical protein
MIDPKARAEAVQILADLRSGELLPSTWENSWPKQTEDLAVKCIGYWVWTLFDDHADAAIRINEHSDEETILKNSIEFLSSDTEFQPRRSGMVQTVKMIFTAGIEWVGCELPWHMEWPYPPSGESKST